MSKRAGGRIKKGVLSTLQADEEETKMTSDFFDTTISEESFSAESSDFSDFQEKTLKFGFASDTTDDSLNGDESEEERARQVVLRLHKTKAPFEPMIVYSHNDADIDGGSNRSNSREDKDEGSILESFNASSPRIKHRVLKSLKDVVEMVEQQDNHEGGLFRKNVLRGNLSESLSRASDIGNKMIPKVALPAAPKFFRDAWVLTELLLTVIMFLYAFLNTNYRINELYNAIYITLSTLNLLLALVDSFYYFHELGSCMILIQRFKQRFRKKRHSDYESLENTMYESSFGMEIDEEDMEAISDRQCSCFKFCSLSPKKKEQLNMWFELIRTILSEALIYPLVVLDLFGVISDPTISDKVNFSFFLIGSFYLVLSVYTARVMVSVLTLLTMKNLLSATQSGRQNVFFIVRFLFHSVGQIVVHLCCVLAVAIKIKQENDHNNGQFHASPILFVVIFGGWFIPILGLMTYFAINYFWAQQFSIGFFVELMSLLQEGDVIESLTLSKDEVAAETKERAQKILEKMEYKQVKKEYKELESTGRIKKLAYPIRLPVFISVSIVYNFILAGFFASLLFTSKNGHIVPIQINDYKGISLIVIMIVISIANIHLIIVSNFAVIVFLGAFVTLVCLPGIISIPVFIGLFVIVQRLRNKTINYKPI